MSKGELRFRSPCKHCWHDTGKVIATYPAYREQVCCKCGAHRVICDEVPPPRGHGPYAPRAFPDKSQPSRPESEEEEDTVCIFCGGDALWDHGTMTCLESGLVAEFSGTLSEYEEGVIRSGVQRAQSRITLLRQKRSKLK